MAKPTAAKKTTGKSNSTSAKAGKKSANFQLRSATKPAIKTKPSSKSVAAATGPKAGKKAGATAGKNGGSKTGTKAGSNAGTKVSAKVTAKVSAASKANKLGSSKSAGKKQTASQQMVGKAKGVTKTSTGKLSGAVSAAAASNVAAGKPASAAQSGAGKGALGGKLTVSNKPASSGKSLSRGQGAASDKPIRVTESSAEKAKPSATKSTATKSSVTQSSVTQSSAAKSSAAKSSAVAGSGALKAKTIGTPSKSQPTPTAMGKTKSAKPTAVKVSAEPVTSINGKSSHTAKSTVPAANGETTASTSSAEKKPAARRKSVKPTSTPTSPAVLQRIRELQLRRESTKDLSKEVLESRPTEVVAEEPPQKDRIVLLVRDSYWLQVTWDITRRAVERARAAMAEHWHHAQPILRLLRLDDGSTTSAAETIERDIVIHGGVRNWYLDLSGTPGRFRVMIGYLSGGRFHMLAKSNIVRTPVPGTGESGDDHWSDIARDAERVFALSGGYDSEQETTELQQVFEDRLKRSMGGPQLAQYGSGAETAFRGRGGFHFDMEVELYVYGSTVPDGFVTLNGEPVKLRSDGTFSLRLPFPDRRQVLPAVACSRDGVQQRTVVIAVERNTKVMEPFSKEQDEPG